MKFHVKVFALCLGIIALLYAFTNWRTCQPPHADSTATQPATDASPVLVTPQRSEFRSIRCLINEEYTVSCIRDDDEVYIPFDFIRHYFEIRGDIEEREDQSVFVWQHSYSKVYKPSGRYSPHGVFMSFEHYNVEIRDRVKCISGMEGVPLSTQWGPHGYYYPIQIAQYGLSHYSKYLSGGDEPTTTLLDDGEKHDDKRWTLVGKKVKVAHVYDTDVLSRVTEFYTPEHWLEPGAKLTATSTSEHFLSLDFRFASNGSITVHVQPRGKQPDTYAIRYVLSNTLITTDGDFDIIIGIGDRTRWSHMTRDLRTDFQKGLSLLHSGSGGGGLGGDRSKSKRGKSRLVLHKVMNIVFRGHGLIDNVTLASSAHLPQFYYAANWLVLHQDERGGWPISVARRLSKDMPELAPGWYSAMAQGQAISLLVRAYTRTHNHKYLTAAVNALNVYSIASSNGGVQAKFADKYVWYEEYPTTPSSFVLNGYIYSLIGLYDLKTVAPTEQAIKAASLYDVGMTSLCALLPLFDTGSGSTYDLRHVGLGSAPNVARWDYHATHINQLLLLATIAPDADSMNLFERTAQRWIGYMKGERAPHN